MNLIRIRIAGVTRTAAQRSLGTLGHRRVHAVLAVMAVFWACGGPRDRDQPQVGAAPLGSASASQPTEQIISVSSTSQDTIAETLPDADGYYALREPAKIEFGPYVIEALSLGPDVSLVRADDRGEETVSPCGEHTVLPDTLHVLCRVTSSEIVSLDGHFLGRRDRDGLVVDVAPGQNPYKIDVLTAILRVSRRGETTYLKRHLFTFRPGE